MSVMPRITPGLNSKPKPEKSRALLRRTLLAGLAGCSLAGLFALPQVAAQVTPRPSAVAPTPTPIGGGGSSTALPAGVDVLTERYNNARNGVNNAETTLTPANSIAGQFGKLYTRTVDGLMYAQPLYVQNLPITNSIGRVTIHNVVFLATNNNSVYAYDADSYTGDNASPLWHVNFNVPGVGGTPTNGTDVTTVFGFPQSDIEPLIGITGTPVIDQATGILYVVARTTEGTNYVHRLHAIDIRTGQEKFDSPALVGQYQDPITSIVSPISVPGNGDNRDGAGHVTFDLLNENQRPALTLVNGVVYVAYGAFDNSPPYHGWVFGFNTANLLGYPSVFCTSPNASAGGGFFSTPTEGGIDMSGAGLASDGSSLFFTTGIGTFNANTPRGTEYGESVLKIGTLASSTAMLPVQSYFTPYNHDNLTNFGQDIGTGGIALLPDGIVPNLPPAMVTAGQEGKIYLLNRTTLGGLQNLDAGAINTFPNSTNSTVPLLGSNYGAPTVFVDRTPPIASPGQVRIFFHAAGDAVRGFNVIPGTPATLDLNNIAYGSADPNPPTYSPITFQYPGAQTTISANNGLNGILWEVEAANVGSPNPSQGFVPNPAYAVLHAYRVSPSLDAQGNVTASSLTEIFNTNQKGGGINSIGDYTKFSQPMVAGGKVFVTAAAPTVFDPGGSTSFPQGRLVVFGTTSTQGGNTGQGARYQLSGPVGWTAFPAGGGLSVGPVIGEVEAARANYYALTALDATNKTQAITGTVTLSLTDAFTGRQMSLGSVTFNNQSYVVFSKTINIPGFYIMKAQDSNGNVSQYYPNIGDIAYIQVVGTSITGFDRFNLRLPTAVRTGQLTNVTVTAVNGSGFPTPVPFGTAVTIYDTLPGGGQDFAVPADANPTDGFGFPNFPPYELLLPNPPYPTFHSQQPFSTINFAYELQYGIADYALTPGWPIGIYDDAGIQGSSYPNANGTGTYPCVFNGVGQHVVIVRDNIFGGMTTGVVNVTQ